MASRAVPEPRLTENAFSLSSRCSPVSFSCAEGYGSSRESTHRVRRTAPADPLQGQRSPHDFWSSAPKLDRCSHERGTCRNIRHRCSHGAMPANNLMLLPKRC